MCWGLSGGEGTSWGNDQAEAKWDPSLIETCSYVRPLSPSPLMMSYRFPMQSYKRGTLRI